MPPSLIGRRINVIGNSCSGKSTLAARLSAILDIPVVELDALNWLPGWVGLNDTDPAEFERRIVEATRGDSWIVAGSYAGFARRLFWDRLDTVIWLDMPLPLLLSRVVARSWRRWRTKELLWGTNYESFWQQLMVWKGEESLIWWIVTQQRPKRRSLRAARVDARWSHIRFVHLDSPDAVRSFIEGIEHAHAAQRRLSA